MNEGDGLLSGEVLESEEKPRKITGKMDKTAIKHAAALTLAENGFGHGAIGKALERHPKHIGAILPKLKKESLAHPRKLKLASKCAEKVMTGYLGEVEKDKEGKPVIDEKGKPVINYDPRVKASDAARMTELVYKAAGQLAGDREQGPGAANQTFIQVNNQFFLPDK